MTPTRKRFLDRLQLTCPADAIRAMIRGLEKASKRKTFVVDMGTYGGAGEDGTCYGCAATCTLMEAAHLKFTADTIPGRGERQRALGVDRVELADFEQAMNYFRQGAVWALFEFFDESQPNLIVNWYLGTDWKQQLPLVKYYLKALEASTSRS